MAGQQQSKRKKLAVWKFASCDGCQLSLLNCEQELLTLFEAVEVAYFPEATRAVVAGPYDLSLVEGSVTTPHDAERILEIRKQSAVLVTIGACATSGGIQALRNFRDHEEMLSLVYAQPAFIESLATSTAIADHVPVDFQLQGCPIDQQQLLQLLAALLLGKAPRFPAHSLCMECKRQGLVCVTVARGQPCLGPVTQAGCGALCPRCQRGCYGCFGPSDSPQPRALAPVLSATGTPPAEVARLYSTFNVARPAFQEGRLIALGSKRSTRE